MRLRLNSSSIIGNTKLKIIEPKKIYCLHLKRIKINNIHQLLHSYCSVSKYYKEITYQIYAALHQVSLQNCPSIQEILKNYNLSTSNIYKYFKEVIGSSPSRILNDRKLLHFIFHLLETNEIIDEYYSEFGFKEKSTLYRNFKNTFGLSPYTFKTLHQRTSKWNPNL